MCLVYIKLACIYVLKDISVAQLYSLKCDKTIHLLFQFIYILDMDLNILGLF